MGRERRKGAKMKPHEKHAVLKTTLIIIIVASVFAGAIFAVAKPSSYAPVVITEDFDSVMTRMRAAKSDIMKRHMDLLNERYDLLNNPALGVTMSRGKPVQQGVRVRLPEGVTWLQLAEMTPDAIREKDLFPKGFLPLPHPNHDEGGMLFPQMVIDEIK